MHYANQTVIITGASSGIGRALAIALAKQGARIGVIARRAEMLAELVDQVRASGGTIAAAPADVANREELREAFQVLEQQLGPVDLLIANAGISESSGGDPQNVAGVERMMQINFFGMVYAFETGLPAMLERKSGHLVAVSSMAAYKGLPGAAGYCASKAAVSVYCESLRIELWPRGVAVSCIYPGFIDTPMTQKNDHPMPFLMSTDAGAARILRALPRRPGVLNFPKRMKLLMWLAKWAPDRVIRNWVPIKVAGESP